MGHCDRFKFREEPQTLKNAEHFAATPYIDTVVLNAVRDEEDGELSGVGWWKR